MCSARTSLTTGDLLRASLAEATEYCPIDSSRATGTTCSVRVQAVQGGVGITNTMSYIIICNAES